MMTDKLAHMLPANLVPSFLKQHRAWVVWRYVQGEGPKPRKIPYYINGQRRSGRQGGEEDRSQLVSFDAAYAEYRSGKWSGLGFAMLSEWGLVGMDFDDCVANGRVDPTIVDLVADTYAELSPSGNGVRAFYTGALSDRKSHSTSDQFGVEVFSAKGFLTITGNQLEHVALVGSEDTAAPLPAGVRDLYLARFGKNEATPATDAPLGLAKPELEELLKRQDPDGDYQRWLNVGMALHHETRGQPYGLDLWDAWSATSSKYPGRESLDGKWETFGKGEGRQVTIRSLLRDANIAVPDDFEDLRAQLAPGRFAVHAAGDFASRPPPQWIIKRVLPRAGLAVLFGESGSGKSFFVLDLVLTIARGLPWRDHKAATARVVYICAEGAGGFRNRLAAYAHEQQLQFRDLPIGVISDVPNLLAQDDLKVSEQIKAFGGADVIVIDTFAQVTPGANENAADDMGKALAHCRRLHEKTGALVLLVHHSGKDASKGARGWSGIKAAADVEIEVYRHDNQRVARISKLKDGEDGREFHFQLQQVVIGIDDDQEEITSCVVRQTAKPIGESTNRKPRPTGNWEILVHGIVEDLAGPGHVGVPFERILELAKERTIQDPHTKDKRRYQARRAIESLAEKGILALKNGIVELPMDEEDALA